MDRMRRGMWLAVLASLACGGSAAKPVAPVVGAPAAEERGLTLAIERAEATGNAAPSAVLGALEAELARSMAALEGAEPAPYFISYQVTDRHGVDIAASRGALTESSARHRRVLDLDVRVGDYEMDNTRPLRDWAFSFRDYGGDAVELPIEDDARALAAAIWLATDRAYKDAVERYIEVKANTAVKVAAEDASADFSREEPVRHLEEPRALAIDRAAWEPRIKAYSTIFEKYPKMNRSAVSLDASVVTRSFASSEGSRVQVSRSYIRLWFWISTTADDGMELSRYDSIELASLDAMPSDEAIRAKIESLVADLTALAAAPVADPFVGPAILEGEAAGVFFHETFGHRVEGHRQKDADEGQTFAKKIGERVMPEFVDVYDDPTIRTLDGNELNGHYVVDDEGVRAQRASLVEGGVLKTFLLARTPTRGFTRSNGHGRRQEGSRAVARQGNLIVHPRRVVAKDALKRALLDEVARQGKPYGLRFTKVQGGFTATGRWFTQTFRVMPVMVYRVYPDGREELIRGSNLEGTPLTSLETILAAGDDVAVFNGYCGAESGMVPVAAASPSLLVQTVELAKALKEQDRPAILDPPPPLKLRRPGGGR